MTSRSLVTLIFCISCTINAVSPQSVAERLPFSAEFPLKEVSFDPGIARPEQVLGHLIGTRHTRPEQVEAYFRQIASQSNRVTFATHGSTYEGRNLFHAIVTSPANQARIEEIRQRNIQLTESPASVSDASLKEMPAVVILGYSIHGNEASGTEAAVLLLYYLAAGQGKAISDILDNAVVIINPMLNPDGRSRFVNWANANRGRVATSDPADREHNEPWPGGRTNHYLFDMNRDWLPAQLKESQGRLVLYHHWRPQLQTDHHEMGSSSTFFFQPGIPTRDNPNTPKSTVELTQKFASFHARQLNEVGSLYYSEESFDDFYYGKGSTYPDVNGAVGILFEQASSRALTRDIPGGRLDFEFTIRNQFASSLSSLAAVVQMKVDLLKNQREFYRDALNIADHDGISAYAFDLDRYPDRGRSLVEVLLRHDIRVYQAANGFFTEGRKEEDYQTAVIVPVRQRQSKLLKTIMERVTSFNDSEFYDISTWSFPQAFGVKVDSLKGETADLLGEQISEVPTRAGFLRGVDHPYAYLLEWSTFSAPSALFKLQQKGVQARLMTIESTVETAAGTRSFPPSTVIIPALQQNLTPEELNEAIREVVAEDGIRVHAVATGLTPSGPDLGGASTQILEMPKVAILAGEGTSSYQVGELWFLLNERLGIPVSLLELSSASRNGLNAYNTLIIPSGSYRELDETLIGKIQEWNKAGGALITTDEGTRWAIEHKLVNAKLREVPKDAEEIAYKDVRAKRQLDSIPGTIFELNLDNSHPVAYRNDPVMAVMRSHTYFVERSPEPGVNVAVYSDNPLLSGYASQKNIDLIKGSLAIIAYRQGSGAVVGFVDDPAFRAHWHGTSSLFINAVFFGRAF